MCFELFILLRQEILLRREHIKRAILINTMLTPIKPFATTPGPFKSCDSSWSVVSLHVLHQMEDI
jgi:hypothetical protein